jgi:hypothetical protein
MNARVLVGSLIGLFLVAGCASNTRRVRVAIPPRVDLAAYQTVGLVTFTSNAKGELDRLTTQRFMQAVQEAQPGTRVVELGSEQQVLASVNAGAWNPATLRAVKAAHGVDVVVLGRLDVAKAKPDFRVSTMIKGFSVRQDVNASLNTKLLETGSGATMWSDGSELTTNVAHASFNARGERVFGASDANDAYGEMVGALVWNVTDDFRTHYVTRRVRKADVVGATAVASAND